MTLCNVNVENPLLMAETNIFAVAGTLLCWRIILDKGDIETNPDFAYDWAEKGIKFERQRILNSLARLKKNDRINEAWFVIEREILNGKLD